MRKVVLYTYVDFAWVFPISWKGKLLDSREYANVIHTLTVLGPPISCFAQKYI